MKSIAQRAGYIQILHLSFFFFWGVDTILCHQIEYFNQRRVIGEAQKDRLARANEATQTQSGGKK